ncbi:DUF2891 domain-containing protein [Capnocytophaga canis]|uniref:DUF2891 domain-containing protein n=1 Tax=Capnocytophaga canis TaxID=1848903 RepID=UPI00370D5811
MKKIILEMLLFPLWGIAQEVVFTTQIAEKLASLPLHCIEEEYPNKTGHGINAEKDARLTPRELHPVFYGCYDWHSSVHGHWMLVRILETMPEIANREIIETVLDKSFNKKKMEAEAAYFTTYKGATTFERTYGWAWILKLDEELAKAKHPKAKQWHDNLSPLTQKIKQLWLDFLPKQTYPNRTGVHPNSAFAMGFAIDWARTVGDKNFENQLIEKSKAFYLKDKNIPAYLEPNGSDFFSPSLETANLMRRILPKKEFTKWLNQFYDKRSLNNIKELPIISDLNDYQIVHLVGLSFSRAWCMKAIAKELPRNHRLKKEFDLSSKKLLNNALPLVFQGNYGGSHWLASFAVYALSEF